MPPAGGTTPSAPRGPWVWSQLLVGWLPVWALFTLLLASVHHMSMGSAALIGLRLTAGAAVLGLGVHRFTGWLPWPRAFSLRFVLLHLAAAAVFSAGWLAFNSIVESLMRGRAVLAPGPGVLPFFVTGVWFYAMIAAMAYAHRAAVRESETAAAHARSQLAALRQQLHPHLLFNALHTVVQLIPVDPRAAERAAELLAGVLRTTFEEQRDLVTLDEEWRFVQRCLAIESLRFGERLRVKSAIDDAALGCLLPSFALQTLVENAVRHGAAPAIDPTEVTVRARRDGGTLVVEVQDDGAGADLSRADTARGGSGLARLRERLHWLYAGSARLDCTSRPGGGFTARLVLPIDPGRSDG